MKTDKHSDEEYVWTPDQLAEFCEHDDPEVRAWALTRLPLVASGELVERCAFAGIEEDESTYVYPAAHDALHRVANEATPARVRTFYERSTASTDEELLAVLGDEQALDHLGRSIDEGIDVGLDWIAERNPEGVEALIRRRWGVDDWPPHPDIPRGAGMAGVEDFVEPVLESLGRLGEYDVRYTLELAFGAASGWVCEIERLDELPSIFSEDVRARLTRAWKANDLEVLLDQLRELGKTPRGDVPWPQLRFALALAEGLAARPELVKADDDWASDLYQLCMFGAFGLQLHGVLSSQAELATAVMLPAPGDSARRWVREFVHDEWNRLREDGAADAVADAVVESFREEPNGSALLEGFARVGALEDFPTEAVASIVIERLPEVEGGGPARDSLGDVLAARPDLLREYAPALFELGDPWHVVALDVLKERPERWASRIVHDHLDDVLTERFDGDVWVVLRSLADPEGIERIVEQWEPGERTIARCAVQIARLAGMEDALPDELIRDADEPSDRSQRGARRAPIALPLRCLQCKRTLHYVVDTVYAGVDEQMEFTGRQVPGRIIVCKRCGAVDEYELGARADLLLAATALSSRTIVPVRLVAFDGTPFSTATEAIELQRRDVERDPENAAAWRRLGGTCARFQEFDEAERALRKAIEVDETEAAAAADLANLLFRMVSVEAMDVFFEAVKRFPRGEMSDELRGRTAEQLVGMLRESAGHLPVALTAAWNESSHPTRATVNMSSVALERIRNWEGLERLLREGFFDVLTLDPEIPPAPPTRLEQLINVGPSALAPLPTSGGTFRNTGPDVGRNDPCPCGSGRKYKKCCMRK